jgi:predicted transcriptional regulator
MAEATTKQEIIEMIKRMPDDASLEDILYELYVRSEIQAGLEDVRAGRTVSHEEVMQEITQWLQSAGR